MEDDERVSELEGSCSPEASFSPLCRQNLTYRLAEWRRQAELAPMGLAASSPLPLSAGFSR